MNKQAIDSVRVVLFDEKGRFLLVVEDDDPNAKLPGGKFEPGETPDQAVAREMEEEVPSGVSDLSFVSELLNHDGISRRFIYTGAVDSRRVVPGEGIDRLAFADLDDMPDTKHAAHILAAVEDVLAKK